MHHPDYDDPLTVVWLVALPLGCSQLSTPPTTRVLARRLPRPRYLGVVHIWRSLACTSVRAYSMRYHSSRASPRPAGILPALGKSSSSISKASRSTDRPATVWRHTEARRSGATACGSSGQPRRQNRRSMSGNHFFLAAFCPWR
jgi:hypothetical protein